MKRPFELVVACVCAAIAWPAMPFERALPRPPDPAKLNREQGSWFHLKKDLWTESLRADCQWWGKLLAFLVISQFVALCVLIL